MRYMAVVGYLLLKRANGVNQPYIFQKAQETNKAPR
jgi:hypothetical protein